jgi:diguanylate cyclase (GGDEF)-like protein
LLGFQHVALFLLEPAGVTEVACWPEKPQLAATLQATRVQIAQEVLQAGRTTFVRKESANHTIVCTPLLGSREIIGAIFLESAAPNNALSAKSQQFIEMFAQQAAACLEHARLYQSAITDPLTGLFCHRHFQQEVEQAVRRAMRNERPVTLLLMDLDHFKKLNDTCGHNVGNKCLTQVAEILRNTFRSTDVLARFGGDEFEMLLPDTPAERAEMVAENVRRKICEMLFPQDRKISATIGIAGYPANSSNSQTLFLCADAALYKAKEAGRNRVMRAEGRMDGLNAATTGVDRTAHLSRQSREEPVTSTTEVSSRIEKVDGHIVLRRLAAGSTGEVLLVLQPGLSEKSH